MSNNVPDLLNPNILEQYITEFRVPILNNKDDVGVSLENNKYYSVFKPEYEWFQNLKSYKKIQFVTKFKIKQFNLSKIDENKMFEILVDEKLILNIDLIEALKFVMKNYHVP